MPRRKGAAVGTFHDPAGIESAEPHARLLAAIIRQAVADARDGDEDARSWLIEDAPGWLPYVVPEDCDLAEIHESLLRVAGYAVCVPIA